MATANDIIEKILGFEEKDFYEDDPPGMEMREEQLLDLDFFGVAVNAPSRIETLEKGDLPLILAARYSGDRDWETPLDRNCILFGTNMHDGTVAFAKAFVDEKALQDRGIKEIGPKGPKPPGLATAAVQLTRLAPKDRLGIAWDTGIWALGVINYDWPSNTVTVELAGEGEPKPIFAKPVSPEPDPRGEDHFPCYLPVSDTPKPPESGLSVAVEFYEREGRQHLDLTGAFGVTIRELHLPEIPIEQPYAKGGEKTVAAVVPLTLAVLGANWDEPLQFNWAVPVYGSSLEVGKQASGYFALNALAGARPLNPGKHLCYLFLDGGIYGPYGFTVPEIPSLPKVNR